MDHDAARRLMAEAVGGRLSGTDETDLALHLVGCAECKTLYEGLQHAHPAVSAIATSPPPSNIIETAVYRATTVLRGEADPGPLARAGDATAPAVGVTPAGAPTELHTTGPMLDPFDEPTPDETDEVFAEPAIATPPPIATPVPTPPVVIPPPAPEPHVVEPGAGHVTPLSPPRDIDEPPTERPFAADPDAVTATPLTPGAVDELEELLDADRGRTRYDETAAEPTPEYYEPEHPAPARPRVGPGPWLAAIAVTIALAVLAAVLISRGDGLTGGDDVPTAEEVRARLDRAFTEMDSLKTTFSIRRLGLYRVDRDEKNLTYSFSEGRYEGRMVYDRAEGYREEVVLTVGDRELTRAKVVQTADETRSLIGSGEGARLLVEKQPPLGPPDGNLRPTIGLLEESAGAVSRILAEATELEVVGKTRRDDREVVQMQATVPATELTRADRIDLLLDPIKNFPVEIRRTISRENARVLGPPDTLKDDAIDTAFGGRERVTTELVELDNVVIDDIILPGDFVLDVPDGVEPQESDAGYERVTRAELSDKLPFKPLFPSTLPGGYELEALAIFTGEPAQWGPRNSYPAPEAIFHASFFNGKTTIVVTQRRFASTFNIETSPLDDRRRVLPFITRPVERAEKRFTYAVSPESPPHAYGFLGNVLAVASGYATEDELVGIIASLSESTAELPAPLDVSPSPGATGSPGASPASSPASSPGASPVSSPAATGSLPGEDV